MQGKTYFPKARGDVLSPVITKIFHGMLATLSAAWLATGCQSPKPESNSEVVMDPSTRNNCYSRIQILRLSMAEARVHTENASYDGFFQTRPPRFRLQ